VSTDLSLYELTELGDEFEDARDRGLSPAAAAEEFVLRMQEMRRRQRGPAVLTVAAVTAEPDPETLQDIYMGGGQGR
jgi:hypothetical protein